MKQFIVAIDNSYYWDGFRQYLGKDDRWVCQSSKAVLLSLPQAQKISKDYAGCAWDDSQPYIIDLAKWNDYIAYWKETYATYVRLGFCRKIAAQVAACCGKMIYPYKVNFEGEIYV